MASSYRLLSWLKRLGDAHDRSLDYLIESWKGKDKYDKAINRIKYQEWHDKYVGVLNEMKNLYE